MDGSHMSLFPSQSWLGFTHTAVPSPVPTELHIRQVNHLAVLILSGACSNQWIRCGRETRFNAARGMVGFFSADQEEHAVASRTDTGAKAFILSIPPSHLQFIAASEGVTRLTELQARPMFEDAIVRDLLARLFANTSGCSITRGLDAVWGYEPSLENMRKLLDLFAFCLPARPAAPTGPPGWCSHSAAASVR
jgi:hypothetical protein